MGEYADPALREAVIARIEEVLVANLLGGERGGVYSQHADGLVREVAEILVDADSLSVVFTK